MLRVGIWEESFKCAGILSLQWQCENFAHRQHFKFVHFQRVRWASKNPISPKVLKRFSKFLHQLEDVEGGHLGGKFQVHRYFIFTMARWKLCASTTFEILPLSTCSLCQQNPISPNVFNRFSKSLPQVEHVEVGHLGGKFLVRWYFTLAMARWKLCAWTTFEILQLSTCTLCQHKSHISKGIQPIFEIVASVRWCWGWAFWRKVSGVQVFNFCNVKVKTLRIDNILNFSTFNLYTVPGKILSLQSCFTDFRNLFLRSKMLSVGIW